MATPVSQDMERSLPDDEVRSKSKDMPEQEESDTFESSTKEAPKTTGPPMPPPPVDSGWLCWLQVMASFAMWVNSWGIVASFGVYQTYYEITNLSNKSSSQISWIGSLQGFFLCFVGPLSGALFDAGWCQALVIVGNLFIVFGLMMTSICKEYWLEVLAQGIVVGLGVGQLYVPSTGIVPQYFVKRRGPATCLAATGSAIGGIIYPIIFRELQPQIGFGWAVRVQAFVALFLGIVASVAIKNKSPPTKPKNIFNPEFWRHVPMVMFSAGAFFLLLGLFVPGNYIGVYGLAEASISEDMAFYLVAIMQAGSVVGRLLPALWVDKFGAVNVLIPSMLTCGILTLCWIAIKNKAGLIVFAILFGAGYGLVLAMMPLAVIFLLKGDMKKFGTYLGLAMFLASPGLLIGNPISGAIQDDSDFTGLQAFAGCIMLLAAAFFFTARIISVGWRIVKV
ncbi:hypothetical protein PRZ48_003895 [Zasmidium cellare]|uniref:Major facilitator superfamily (MFS) profile domain-containing protein n=1 Tax=Zasmidium cellare TaxID=395010 RepID=A0ABR0EXE9_ZASCE|nr:hypothetical protein PRZ48_003895 [Zasmidium cellare]